MHPELSIIIPCYNTEKTLEETLESVLSQNYSSWEAIIVNDGSPDNLETIALAWTKKDSRFRYYKKINGGLGSARNFGIEKALGTYILPLDSDNNVRPEFAQEALTIMDSQKEVGVVYGDAMYFGSRTGKWHVGSFDKYKMLNHNYIDACAIIRKSLFETIGVYEEALPHQGHEDWDFWMRVMKSDFNFYYLNKVTFDYRVEADSMIRTFSDAMITENINYIKQKHYDLYVAAYKSLLKENVYLRKELSKPLIKKVLKKLKIT